MKVCHALPALAGLAILLHPPLSALYLRYTTCTAVSMHAYAPPSGRSTRTRPSLFLTPTLTLTRTPNPNQVYENMAKSFQTAKAVHALLHGVQTKTAGGWVGLS